MPAGRISYKAALLQRRPQDREAGSRIRGYDADYDGVKAEEDYNGWQRAEADGVGEERGGQWSRHTSRTSRTAATAALRLQHHQPSHDHTSRTAAAVAARQKPDDEMIGSFTACTNGNRGVGRTAARRSVGRTTTMSSASEFPPLIPAAAAAADDDDDDGEHIAQQRTVVQGGAELSGEASTTVSRVRSSMSRINRNSSNRQGEERRSSTATANAGSSLPVAVALSSDFVVSSSVRENLLLTILLQKNSRGRYDADVASAADTAAAGQRRNNQPSLFEDDFYSSEDKDGGWDESDAAWRDSDDSEDEGGGRGWFGNLFAHERDGPDDISIVSSPAACITDSIACALFAAAQDDDHCNGPLQASPGLPSQERSRSLASMMSHVQQETCAEDAFEALSQESLSPPTSSASSSSSSNALNMAPSSSSSSSCMVFTCFFLAHRPFTAFCLGREATRVATEPNAGGASTVSESLSVEYFARRFGACNVVTEMEISYRNINWKRVDYICDIYKQRFGVSVTRAMSHPNPHEFDERDARGLLHKKLFGLVVARSGVLRRHSFTRCILHVWCQTRRIASLMQAEFPGLARALGLLDDVIMVLTIAEGRQGLPIFYESNCNRLTDTSRSGLCFDNEGVGGRHGSLLCTDAGNTKPYLRAEDSKTHPLQQKQRQQRHPFWWLRVKAPPMTKICPMNNRAQLP